MEPFELQDHKTSLGVISRDGRLLVQGLRLLSVSHKLFDTQLSNQVWVEDETPELPFGGAIVRLEMISSMNLSTTGRIDQNLRGRIGILLNDRIISYFLGG